MIERSPDTPESGKVIIDWGIRTVPFAWRELVLASY